MARPVKYKAIDITEFIDTYDLDGNNVGAFLTDGRVVDALHAERMSGWEFLYIHGQRTEASVVFREVQP